MNFESKFLLLIRRSNLIFYRIQGLFDAKKQITIKIHIISSKYDEKITSENHLNRLKIRPLVSSAATVVVVAAELHLLASAMTFAIVMAPPSRCYKCG